jgi:hypothetical protein
LAKAVRKESDIKGPLELITLWIAEYKKRGDGIQGEKGGRERNFSKD